MRGRLSTAAAGTLLAVLAGCGEPPVSPLPTQAPAASGAAPGAPDCLGAVSYDVDASAPDAPVRSLCFHPGATLRVSNVGPDEVTAEPAALVSRADEDGLTTVTFTGTGDLTVTVVWQNEPYVIAVEVRPSPSDAD